MKTRGEQEWHLGVREREREWIIPFPKFGKRKGIEKNIPSIREREGNEKNPFPQFGNRNQRLSFPRIPGNRNGNGKKHNMTIKIALYCP